ncbi:MAG: hypothetical protein AUJ20_12065 [Comamonadaceae bacterium CG1_02_60_18]|nr:MAG: hypothetical protein AUJ20_12065 [Comamonadaceae bacterium CG1_02_60_18]PIQ51468.1 MAG: hypothetical protein COW02_14660 [Comamonadaceae bacterium CG12_big_fil_rev_8_21_14_0_65_59_15]
MQADASDEESLSSLRGRRPRQSMDSEGMDCSMTGKFQTSVAFFHVKWLWKLNLMALIKFTFWVITLRTRLSR